MKFRSRPDPTFHRALRRAVDRYFALNGRHRFATPGLWLKAALYAGGLIGGWLWLVAGPISFIEQLAAYTLFGMASLLLVLNLAHDAAHNALVPSRRVNRILFSLTFGTLGVDAPLWAMRHVHSHHLYPNINGCDADIDHNPFLRLSPNHPWRPRHRFQHLYAPLIYMLVNLHAALVQDVIYIFKTELANLRGIRHPPSRYIGFVLGKLAYIGLVLAAPILTSHLPSWQVALAHVASTAVMSLFFVVTLTGTHFADGNAFPALAEDGTIEGSFTEHVFASSLDWHPTSKLAAALVGGLNAHVAHHLFPAVSHAHYPAISAIIERLARRHGIAYRRTSWDGLVGAHFRHLCRLGQADAV